MDTTKTLARSPKTCRVKYVYVSDSHFVSGLAPFFLILLLRSQLIYNDTKRGALISEIKLASRAYL